MNWKLEAREKLQSYPTRRASCDSLKNELRRLEYEAEGLKSPTLGESVQLSHSAQDDRIVTNLVHRKELEQRLRETELWLETVDGALSALTEQERLILRRMYMEGGRGNLDRLPKLRGHFAEFLNNPSPDGLRILSSSTCVGLRYGH